MFRLLGILLLVYVAYALHKGEVYAKHRWSGRTVYRNDSPGYFATVIAIYIILGIALITVF